MSKSQELLRYVYAKGYRVTAAGVVLNPQGQPRKSVRRVTRGMAYFIFNVLYADVSRPVPVHRLVAYQKYGEEMFKHEAVRHKNGDSLDNSPKNIVLGSQSDNMLDRDPAARREHALKASRTLRQFTYEQAEQIRADRNGGMLIRELCEKYGAHKSTISMIVNRKLYDKP